MLLQLIKTRPFISGCHCEILELNPILGNRLLAEVFILNEHLPSELIYPLSVTRSGIHLAGRQCGWQFSRSCEEAEVEDYLRAIQRTREEIRIEVCAPVPDLPGYPYVDYHPDDFPIVLGQEEDFSAFSGTCLQNPETPPYGHLYCPTSKFERDGCSGI